MIIRALDENFDWQFGKGIQSYNRDLAGLLQNVQTRLKSWKGDSFASPAEGVDYNNFLDVGTKTFLDLDLKRVILQSEGVLNITEYTSSIERDERGFTAQAAINTIYGPGSIGV